MGFIKIFKDMGCKNELTGDIFEGADCEVGKQITETFWMKNTSSFALAEIRLFSTDKDVYISCSKNLLPAFDTAKLTVYVKASAGRERPIRASINAKFKVLRD
jgi:hypothetical protein